MRGIASFAGGLVKVACCKIWQEKIDSNFRMTVSLLRYVLIVPGAQLWAISISLIRSNIMRILSLLCAYSSRCRTARTVQHSQMNAGITSLKPAGRPSPFSCDNRERKGFVNLKHRSWYRVRHGTLQVGGCWDGSRGKGCLAKWQHKNFPVVPRLRSHPAQTVSEFPVPLI
jgi:hypothetical protein